MTFQPDGTTLAEIDPKTAKDRFFYGFRDLYRKGKDGKKRFVRIPLTALDVLHPKEGDRISTNDPHIDDFTYLRLAFKQILQDRPDTQVLSDHLIDWQVVPRIRPHAPDVIVLEGLAEKYKGRKATLPVRTLNARPVLIVEVTSPATRSTDFGKKVLQYYTVGVPLYIIVDRLWVGDERTETIVAFKADPAVGAYVELSVDPKLGFWIDPLKVWLRIVDGKGTCFDASGRKILVGNEFAEQYQKLEARAKKAKAREAKKDKEIEALRAENRRLKGE